MNNEEFILRLGKSKQDKFYEEFSMLHDETVFEIIRAAGSEAFALYYALNSYTRGKTGVIAFPKNDTLSSLLGANIRSIQRWKQKLKELDIICVVPCYLPDGRQTSSVTLLNAAYPEIPDGWEVYKPGSFIKVYGQLPQFIPATLEKSYTMAHDKNVAGMNPPLLTDLSNLTGQENGPRQICHGQNIGHDISVVAAATDMSSSPPPVSPDGTRPAMPFFEAELNVFESYEEEEVRVSQNNPINPQNPIVNSVATDVLQRDLHPDEHKLLRDLQLTGIREETIIQGIRDSSFAFKPKYATDRIKSLQYCTGRILELHAVLQSAPTALSVGAGERTASRRPGNQRVTETDTNRRVIPAAQPGKYDRFYEIYKAREQASSETT